MAVNAQSYDALIAALYRGSMQRPPWQDFLPLLRKHCQAMVVSLVLRPPSPGDQGLILNSVMPGTGTPDPGGGDQDWQVTAYHERFFAMDPFVHLPPGKVFSLQELVDPEELTRSKYYQAYLKPAGVFHILGADLHLPEGMEARLRLSRAPRAKPFDSSCRSLCQRLLPHLDQALQLHLRLRTVQSERDLYGQAMERLALGSILLDEQGRVVSSNEPASRLLAQGEILRLDDGQLKCTTAKHQQVFEELFQRAVQSQRSPAPAMVEAMHLPRNGTSDLGIVIRPVPNHQGAEGTSGPVVAVLISDSPQGVPESSPQVLRQLFDLSPAEARLALLLAQGLTLSEAAQQLFLSQHTLRSQLKSIFAKTGVKRQAALVQLILKSIAMTA